jgi:hypothetical protein
VDGKQGPRLRELPNLVEAREIFSAHANSVVIDWEESLEVLEEKLEETE